MEDNNGTYKLPILKIIIEALTLPRVYSTKVLKFGMPFVTIGILYSIYINTVIGKEQPSHGGLLLLFPISLVLMASLVMAIVGLHRTFLMQDNDVANTKAFRWTGRETRFVGWWFRIGICTLVIALPILMILAPFARTVLDGSIKNSYLIFIILSALNLPIYYVVSRWMLVLPATAIDERNKSLTWAWDLSYGNGWRLAFLVSGLPFLMNLLIGLLPYPNPVSYSVISGILWLITGTIGVALLSLSYSYLSKNISLEDIEKRTAKEPRKRPVKSFDFEPDGPKLQD